LSFHGGPKVAREGDLGDGNGRSIQMARYLHSSRR